MDSELDGLKENLTSSKTGKEKCSHTLGNEESLSQGSPGGLIQEKVTELLNNNDSNIYFMCQTLH